MNSGSPSLSAKTRSESSPDEFLHMRGVEPAEREHRGVQAPQPVPGRDAVRAPGEQEQQAAPAQPAGEEREHVERRLVGGVDIVDEHQPGHAEHGGDPLQQPRLRGRAGHLQRRREALAPELGREHGRIRDPLRRERARRFRAGGLAEQLDDRPVGEPGLVLVAARREHNAAGGADQLAREP